MNQTSHFPVFTEIRTSDPDHPVTLQCCPVTCNPLTPNIVMTLQEFTLEPYSRGRTVIARSHGPVLLDDVEVVEVQRTVEIDGRIIGKETHWLGIDSQADTDGEIVCRLREVRGTEETEDGGPMDYVELVESRFPIALMPGFEAKRVIRYVQGDYEGHEIFHDRVDGTVEATIDDASELCLKLRTAMSDNANASGREVITFIAVETGYPVFVQILENGRVTSVRHVTWDRMASRDMG